MAVTQPKIVQMHRRLKSRLIHACRFRIYTQNLHINNSLVDIRCLICHSLINTLINEYLIEFENFQIFTKLNANTVCFRYLYISIPIIAPDKKFVHNGIFTTSVILCCMNTLGRLVYIVHRLDNSLSFSNSISLRI